MAPARQHSIIEDPSRFVARSHKATLGTKAEAPPPNAPAKAAGAVGVAGPVELVLCSPCRNGQNGRQAISDDIADALEDGASGYYVNVHTAKNAAGEIRGQLKHLAD